MAKRRGLWWKVPLLSLGGLLLFVLLAVAVALSDWGLERIRRVALPAINRSVQGEVHAERVRRKGATFWLEGVSIEDPEGKQVARLDELKARLSLGALFDGRIVVEELALQAPELDLRQTERGLNLSRALESTKPPEPKPPNEGPSSMDLAIESLRLRDGQVRYVDETASPPNKIALHDLNLESRARVQLPETRVNLKLEGKARAKAPFEGPVQLSVQVAPERATGRAHDVKLDLRAAGSRVALAGKANLDPEAPSGTLRLEPVEIDPRLVEAFAPNAPLISPLRLTGTIEGDRKKARVDLDLKTEGGDVSVQARADLGQRPKLRAEVRSTPINLARILDGGVPSDLKLNADVNASGTSLKDLQGRLSLTLPPGQLAGRKTGPIEIALHADEGDVTLERVDVQVPGVQVRADGWLRGLAEDDPQLRVTADVKLRDLGATARTLLASAGPPPPVNGRGELHLEAKGRLGTLNAQLVGAFPRLVYGDTRVRNLELAAHTDSVLHPWSSTATVTADRIDAGGRVFRNARVNLRAPEPLVTELEAQVAGQLPVLLRAHVRWLDPGESLVLQELLLRYPGTVWRNTQPARVSWKGPVQVDNLRLRADDQRLAADLTLNDDGRMKADVEITSFELGGLAPLVGKDGAARGQISLEAHLRGKLPLPQGQISVQLEDAAFARYGPVTAALQTRLRPDRARGELVASGAGTTMQARFDVPTAWPWPASQRANLSVQALIPSLKAAAQSLGLDGHELPTGSLAMNLDYQGRSGKPLLMMDVQAKSLAVGKAKLGDLSLHVGHTRTSPLAVTLKLQESPLARQMDVNLETPLYVNQLLRRPGKDWLDSLSHRASRLTVRVDDLDVNEVMGAAQALDMEPEPGDGRAEASLQGLVDLQAEGSGTLMSPRGHARVHVQGLKGPGLPPTNVELAVDATLERIATTLQVLQRIPAGGGASHTLLALKGAVDVPAQQRKAEAWLHAPLALQGTVGPIKLQHVGLPGQTLGGFRGRAQMTFEVEGTAARPDVRLAALLQDVATESGALGKVELHARYHEQKPAVWLALQAAAGGALLLEAGARNPLPWQDLLQPAFSPEQVPLRLKMKADDLALAAFGGFSRNVRNLAGRLDGQLAFDGTLDQPSFAGSLLLENGALDVVEVGRFRDIRMDLRGTEDAVVLDELKFRSGAGRGTLSFAARRSDDRGLVLNMEADLSRFPLQTPQRKLGELSLNANARGHVNADEFILAPLEISEADVFLEGKSPKALQDLSPPRDVILLRGGKPLNEDEAKRMAKLGPPLVDPKGADVLDDEPKGPVNPAVLPVTVKVKAPRNLWIHGPDANLELGLSPDFQVVRDGELQVFGTVEIRRGTVSVLGRRFDVQDDAQIVFTGPPDQPRLDVTVTHVNEREQIKVFVTIKGSPDDVELAFRSDPARGESEIVTLLLTGRLNPARGGGESPDRAAQAASVVGGLLASRLQRSALRSLPIDVLSISANAIEAGTYVTDDLYLGYVRRLAASPWRYENVNAVHLDYQISSAWSFEGEYGDAGTGSGDLIWKRRY